MTSACKLTSMTRLHFFGACLALSPCMATGQVLGDPMQPPPLFAAPSTAASSPANPTTSLALQSTLVSSGRRIAIIDGKLMKIGDIIDGISIVAIDSTSVTLRDALSTRVLELHKGFKNTH